MKAISSLHFVKPSHVLASIGWAVLGLLALSRPSWAEDATSSTIPGAGAISTGIKLAVGDTNKWFKDFTLTPRMLQAKDGGPASLGVGYSVGLRPISQVERSGEIGKPTQGNLSMYALEFNAKGLYAAKAEVNTENVIDAATSGSYTILFNGLYSKSAFSGAYAQQQGNATHNARWEVSETLGYWATSLNNTELLARAAYARVNPTKDTARKAALGKDPSSYNRLELEVLAIVPINAGALQKIELRHLRFKEPGADPKIKAANLDQTKLSSIYARLSKGVFIAFSKGGVPADRKDAQVLQVGWSTDAF